MITETALVADVISRSHNVKCGGLWWSALCLDVVTSIDFFNLKIVQPFKGLRTNSGRVAFVLLFSYLCCPHVGTVGHF